MAAYILRRILLMIPTIVGIMAIRFLVVQFAPGGPVERVIAQLPAVKTRDDLIAITRTIDRVVRARHTIVPAWYLPAHRTAYWDVFGHPATKPDYAFQPESTWWFDRDRAAAIGYRG